MKESDPNTTMPVDQDLLALSKISKENVSSPSEALPLLNQSTLKHDQHRRRKRDRYANSKPEVIPATKIGKSDDNQKTHLSCMHHVHDSTTEECTKAKRWNCKEGTEESLLPQIALKPAVSSSKKGLSSPVLRKVNTLRTWNDTLKPQRVANDFRSTLQRRSSSSNDTLFTFEATETILLAEIDSDERCARFLRQRAPREALLSHHGNDHSSQSQIQYKLRDLDRKIQMNKEKLVQVRERIVKLGGEPSRFIVPGAQEEPEIFLKKSEDQHPKTNQHKSKPKKFSSLAATAIVIQCAFRAFRARCQLVDLLAKTYQRVLNPGSSQYYYYNRITRQSQWEPPLLMHRCHYSHDTDLVSPATLANPATNIDAAQNAAAKVIQVMFRQRSLRVFMQDLKIGNLEKIFDAGFGAWYYFNSRTNRSFWENAHHVSLTSANSAIYHRHQPR